MFGFVFFGCVGKWVEWCFLFGGVYVLCEIVLINIIGEDCFGFIVVIIGVLVQGGVNIFDIGQVVIYDILLFGILVEILDIEVGFLVFKDVLFIVYKLDQQVCFILVLEEDYW